MNYKAAIFDLDGTLIDTLDDLANCMNAALCSLGYPAHETHKYKYFVGDGVAALARRTLPAGVDDEEIINKCVSAMRKEYSTRWNEKSHPYEGIPELLDGLSTRGIKMAVLSNKLDEFTKLVVEKFLSKWKFEVVFGERKGVPKKPDPSAAFEVAELLGVCPEECLYLGDTDVDMKTANSAGMFAIGVLWGFRQADELLAHGAKMLVEKPDEVLSLLIK